MIEIMGPVIIVLAGIVVAATFTVVHINSLKAENRRLRAALKHTQVKLIEAGGFVGEKEYENL